jgi:hypothetical protein
VLIFRAFGTSKLLEQSIKELARMVVSTGDSTLDLRARVFREFLADGDGFNLPVWGIRPAEHIAESGQH